LGKNLKIFKMIEQKNKTNDIIRKDDIINASKHKSNLPLSEINKGMKLKIYWVIFFFFVAISFLIIFKNHKTVSIILAIIIADNLTVLLYYTLKYRKMYVEPTLDEQVRKTINQYLKQLNSVLKFERIYSLFSIPAYFIAGITISICLSGNYNILNNNIFIGFMVFAIIILIPITIIGINWMQKKAFGSYQERLKLFLQN